MEPIEDQVAPTGDMVLYAERLSEEAQTETLLAALLVPRIPILITGGGPLAHRVATSTDGTVTYVGHVRFDSVADLIVHARVHLIPRTPALQRHRVDGTRRRVVGSRLVALAEVMDDGETGLLTPPGDPAAPASAIQELRDDPARAERMGRNAWDQARVQFDPLVQTRKLVALYEHALASPPVGRG
jgi:glycosyltransferase involved in cell wall biosynthesis